MGCCNSKDDNQNNFDLNISPKGNRATKLINHSKEPSENPPENATLYKPKLYDNDKEENINYYDNEKYNYIQEFNSNTNLNKNFEVYENCVTVNNLLGDNNNTNNSDRKILNKKINLDKEISINLFKKQPDRYVAEEKIKHIVTGISTSRTARDVHRSKNQDNIYTSMLPNANAYDMVVYDDDCNNAINSEKRKIKETSAVHKDQPITILEDIISVSNLRSATEKNKILMKFKTFEKKPNSMFNTTEKEKPTIKRHKSKNSRYDDLDLCQTIDILPNRETSGNFNKLEMAVDMDVDVDQEAALPKLAPLNFDLKKTIVNLNPDQEINQHNSKRILQSNKEANLCITPEKSRTPIDVYSVNSSTAVTPIPSRKVSQITNSIANESENNREKSGFIPTISAVDILKSPYKPTKAITHKDNYNYIPRDNKNKNDLNVADNDKIKPTYDKIKETIETRQFDKENRLCQSLKENPFDRYNNDSGFLNNSGNYVENNLLTSVDVLNTSPSKVFSSENKFRKFTFNSLNRYAHLLGDVIKIPKFRQTYKYIPKIDDDGEITNIKSRRTSRNNSIRKDAENNTMNDSLLKISLDQSIIKDVKEFEL